MSSLVGAEVGVRQPARHESAHVPRRFHEHNPGPAAARRQGGGNAAGRAAIDQDIAGNRGHRWWCLSPDNEWSRE